MQSLRGVNKLLPGILFLLLAVSAPIPPPPCAAVTIEEIYDDDAGEGFKDGTNLTPTQKNFLSARGNDAETLGKARKNAFERATSILEQRLGDTNTIRVSAEFAILSDQEDPNNPGQCRALSGSITIASAGPAGHGYRGSRLDEGNSNNPGLGTAYPYALIEALLGREFNGQDADISIEFSKCFTAFYYGFTEPAPPNQVDFIQIALHEIVHGLGFLERVNQDGSFQERLILITETVNGMSSTRQIRIKSRTIYDEQLYSEADDDLFTDLTDSERAAAIISGTGLLWDGTDGERNSCSYGQRMAELKSASARDSDGKPRLHAPSTYTEGRSIIHTHQNTEDVMEAFSPAPRNMDLTLAMLKDMGWSVSADGFPPDCQPTGITVTDTSGLVTTEGGGTAKFKVKLESEPGENVVIPLTSSDTSEGTPHASKLTFTTSNWNKVQEVTVTGADDDSHDGPQTYSITLGAAESDDRFYSGFVPEPRTVSLRNDDNDPFPSLLIEDKEAGEGDGSINFTVTLSPQSARTVAVQYSIADDTARRGSDYTATASGTLTFAPGQTEKTIDVTLIDDDEQEANETFTITLRNPQNAAFAQNGATATGTIRDNDGASPPPSSPLPSLLIEDKEAGEGDGSINFTVTLSPQSARTVAVQYSIADDTARQGSDYTATASGTLTFAPGQTEKTIEVTLIDDDEQEANETFTITLRNPQNAALAQNGATATGTIRDNDGASPPPSSPLPSLLIEDKEAGEGDGSINFTVTLSPQSARTVAVQYSIADDTARQGSDYTATASGTLTFAPGQTEKTIEVTLIDDDEQEANETFTITLRNPQNAALAQNGATATGTIRDNDGASPPPSSSSPDRGTGGGSGGCAIASSGQAGSMESALLNLLLTISSVFSAFVPGNHRTPG